MSTLPLAFTAPAGPSGAPYLLLGHSLGTSALLWEEAGAELEQTHRVIRWELPGHGAAKPARAPYTVEQVAASVITHLDLAGIERVRCAGVSFGGTVSLELARAYPGRIAASAVISTGARTDEPSAWLARAEAVRREGTTSLVQGSRHRWFSPATRDTSPDRVRALLDVLERTDDESYARTCESLATYDVSDRLHEVSPPVLAVWGAQDVLVPEPKLREIADGVRDGRAVGLADAAHAGPFEQPQQTVELLTGFFRDADSRSDASIRER